MPFQALATIPYFLKEQIRSLIIDGTFRPGQPLREQDLEQRFGTSRSPIREALRLLELSGMVQHIQRKGFRVRHYSVTEIRHLYALYAELAAYGLRQIHAASEIARLQTQLRELDEQLRQAHGAGDIDTYVARLRDSYLAPSRLLGDQALLDTLSRLCAQLEPVHYLYLRTAMGSLAYDRFHGGILAALAQADTAAAAEAARQGVLDMIQPAVSAQDAVAIEGEPG
ncbi:GntR family transcriptional regulator [Bordetella trematum]|uniref:GntR family transcriptional regulator n=1 Tax=Bordetella trematum TaxID=123899 RepID=UPI003988A26A